MFRLKALTAALIVLLAVLPGAALALEKGSEFPKVGGQTLDDSRYSLGKLKGRPILLKVGTTWCPTCKQQTQEIDKIRAFLSENDVQYVEVFIRQNAAAVKNFFTAKEFEKPDVVLLDQGTIARVLNVYVIPRVLLIDRDFRVYRDGQPLPAAELQNELRAMLALQD
jgi:thiol-disulfide isomerase/thioredoxin